MAVITYSDRIKALPKSEFIKWFPFGSKAEAEKEWAKLHPEKKASDEHKNVSKTSKESEPKSDVEKTGG